MMASMNNTTATASNHNGGHGGPISSASTDNNATPSKKMSTRSSTGALPSKRDARISSSAADASRQPHHQQQHHRDESREPSDSPQSDKSSQERDASPTEVIDHQDSSAAEAVMMAERIAEEEQRAAMAKLNDAMKNNSKNNSNNKQKKKTSSRSSKSSDASRSKSSSSTAEKTARRAARKEQKKAASEAQAKAAATLEQEQAASAKAVALEREQIEQLNDVSALPGMTTLTGVSSFDMACVAPSSSFGGLSALVGSDMDTIHASNNILTSPTTGGGRCHGGNSGGTTLPSHLRQPSSTSTGTGVLGNLQLPVGNLLPMSDELMDNHEAISWDLLNQDSFGFNLLGPNGSLSFEATMENDNDHAMTIGGDAVKETIGGNLMDSDTAASGGNKASSSKRGKSESVDLTSAVTASLDHHDSSKNWGNNSNGNAMDWSSTGVHASGDTTIVNSMNHNWVPPQSPLVKHHHGSSHSSSNHYTTHPRHNHHPPPSQLQESRSDIAAHQWIHATEIRDHCFENDPFKYAFGDPHAANNYKLPPDHAQLGSDNKNGSTSKSGRSNSRSKERSSGTSGSRSSSRPGIITSSTSSGHRNKKRKPQQQLTSQQAQAQGAEPLDGHHSPPPLPTIESAPTGNLEFNPGMMTMNDGIEPAWSASPDTRHQSRKGIRSSGRTERSAGSRSRHGRSSRSKHGSSSRRTGGSSSHPPDIGSRGRSSTWHGPHSGPYHHPHHHPGGPPPYAPFLPPPPPPNGSNGGSGTDPIHSAFLPPMPTQPPPPPPPAPSNTSSSQNKSNGSSSAPPREVYITTKMSSSANASGKGGPGLPQYQFMPHPPPPYGYPPVPAPAPSSNSRRSGSSSRSRSRSGRNSASNTSAQQHQQVSPPMPPVRSSKAAPPPVASLGPPQHVGSSSSLRQQPVPLPVPSNHQQQPPSQKGIALLTLPNGQQLTRSQAPGIGWPPEEDLRLTEVMSNHKSSQVNWESLCVEHGMGRTARECHDRWTRYLKPGSRKGQWREEEDAIVLRVIFSNGGGGSIPGASGKSVGEDGKDKQSSSRESPQQQIYSHGQPNHPPFTQWADLAPQLPGRTGKQIRDRWVNYLNPAINHLPFSRDDDLRLWAGHKELGKRWVEISVKIFHSARSENHIKNRWYSAAFKKFISKEFGIDAYVDAKQAQGGIGSQAQQREREQQAQREQQQQQQREREQQQQQQAAREQAQQKAAREQRAQQSRQGGMQARHPPPPPSHHAPAASTAAHHHAYRPPPPPHPHPHQGFAVSPVHRGGRR